MELTATLRKKPRIFLTPAQREMIRAVKQAVCEIYEINEHDLIHMDCNAAARLRFYCFWILAKKADLKDTAIADAFERVRSTVQYGIEQIDGQRIVYRETSAGIRAVEEAANKFPKKFDWCIQ